MCKIACLRTEQAQLSRSLEKERQRASENRQEYLAAMEEAATHEGRAKQLEDEIRELRSKHKHQLQEELTHRELLEKVPFNFLIPSPWPFQTLHIYSTFFWGRHMQDDPFPPRLLVVCFLDALAHVLGIECLIGLALAMAF